MWDLMEALGVGDVNKQPVMRGLTEEPVGARTGAASAILGDGSRMRVCKHRRKRLA